MDDALRTGFDRVNQVDLETFRTLHWDILLCSDGESVRPWHGIPAQHQHFNFFRDLLLPERVAPLQNSHSITS
jgi:hypothetical protein